MHLSSQGFFVLWNSLHFNTVNQPPLLQADIPKFSKNKCQQRCNSDKLKWKMFLTVYGSECQCATWLIWGKAQISWLLGPTNCIHPKTHKSQLTPPIHQGGCRIKNFVLKDLLDQLGIKFQVFYWQSGVWAPYLLQLVSPLHLVQFMSFPVACLDQIITGQHNTYAQQCHSFYWKQQQGAFPNSISPFHVKQSISTALPNPSS